MTPVGSDVCLLSHDAAHTSTDVLDAYLSNMLVTAGHFLSESR